MSTTDEPSRYRPLAGIDVGMIAMAMSNSEGGYYDPNDGSAILIMDGEALTGEDSETDPDDLGWIPIDPVDSRDAYSEMTDFADVVTDPVLADRLTRALDGRGAFRRFRDTLAEDDLYPIWARYSNALEEKRSLEWLVEMDICDPAEAVTAFQERTHASARALSDIAAWHRSAP
ncbi:UPF0158 family protein [Cryobacterium sp. SO1]|uniref:UPF0158 family protein n=1 Tax=Cryobacterium sp. SO1 TaxID=1897061 RepID=UPI0013EE7ADB|nr:UPF0158 family protein [Cryobacterium sp. SO1]